MNDLMICKYTKCNKYLFEPILLPCSHNICRAHVDQLTKIDEQHYKCLVCSNHHEYPKNGFILNTLVSSIIDSNFHLNEMEKKVATLINSLRDDIHKFESDVRDPQGFIYDYFSSVRHKIDTERERIIYEINNFSDEMIKTLKTYEEQCKENARTLSEINENHKTYLSKLSNDLLNVNKELRIPNIQKTRIDYLMRMSSKWVKSIKRKHSAYKNNLLMNKSCSFIKANTKFDQKLFGELSFASTANFEYIDDKNTLHSPILTAQQRDDLIKLCQFDLKTKFKLLYQATKDGFTTRNFHDKCDGMENTLTIIKVKDKSNIFGGFCSEPWDESNKFKFDSKAFIFSLINQDNRPMKIEVSVPAVSIYCGRNSGPTFGALDIYLANNSNENNESCSILGNGYKTNLYPYGTVEAQNYLAGSSNFTTEEIEVYQVIF